MSSPKLNINIVYSPQKRGPHVIFENKLAKVYNSKTYDQKKINIGMGWYSIRNPKAGDSLIVIEPRCVLERDYNPKFISKFKYIFTWATKAFNNIKLPNTKIIEVNHPCAHSKININNLSKKWTPWQQRENEVVFIANNKQSPHISQLYTLRVKLADMFHHQSNMKVSWYGQIPLNKPYYKGTVKSKFDVLSKAKFTVCSENSYHKKYSHNYFTEKLPDAWKGGAVPLYMGCYNIDDFKFHPDSYIDLRKYVKKDFTPGSKYHEIDKKLLKLVDNFTENQYKKLIRQVKLEAEKPKGLNHIVSYDRFYEKIIETMLKDK